MKITIFQFSKTTQRNLNSTYLYLLANTFSKFILKVEWGNSTEFPKVEKHSHVEKM